MSARLDAAPPAVFGPFNGATSTIEEMVKAVRGVRGERSTLLRGVTERVIAGLQPKDYLSEIRALRDFVARNVRYVNDPLTTEWVKDPQRLAEEILATGKAHADCDEIAALLAAMARQVGREAEFVTVGFGRPGRFTHVFARVKEPKSGQWVVVDPVAGSDEATMLRRVRTHRIWRID